MSFSIKPRFGKLSPRISIQDGKFHAGMVVYDDDGNVVSDSTRERASPVPRWIARTSHERELRKADEARREEARAAADPLLPIKAYTTDLFNLGKTGNICFITKDFDNYTSRWWYVIDSNGCIHRVRSSDAPSARSFESISDFISDLSRFVNKYDFEVTSM